MHKSGLSRFCLLALQYVLRYMNLPHMTTFIADLYFVNGSIYDNRYVLCIYIDIKLYIYVTIITLLTVFHSVLFRSVAYSNLATWLSGMVYGLRA